MKTRIILLTVLINFSLILLGQTFSAREILLKSSRALKNHNLFTYEAEFRRKLFDSSDTSEVIGCKCTVLKAPADTILNYYARIYTENEERIYDGYTFLLIWHDHKKIIKDNPHITGRNFINNNIKRECIPNFFYSENPFDYYLTEAKDMRISEGIVYSTKFWKIEISLPTDEEITFFRKIIYIDQDNFYPYRIESFARYQNIQDEYSELLLKDIRGLTNSDTDFHTYYKYPEDYEEEIYIEPQINYELLANGTFFIPIVGVDLNGAKHSLTFDTIADNLILLDFWYLGCPPCLRAIPELSELAKKYKKQGLTVFGLDPYDGQNKSEEIKKFANRLRIEYPLLIIDKAVSEKYRVKSYPTIYLVKKGVIIYSHIGYSEDKMKVLGNAIKSNLKE